MTDIEWKNQDEYNQVREKIDNKRIMSVSNRVEQWQNFTINRLPKKYVLYYATRIYEENDNYFFDIKLSNFILNQNIKLQIFIPKIYYHKQAECKLNRANNYTHSFQLECKTFDKKQHLKYEYCITIMKTFNDANQELELESTNIDEKQFKAKYKETIHDELIQIYDKLKQHNPYNMLNCSWNDAHFTINCSRNAWQASANLKKSIPWQFGNINKPILINFKLKSDDYKNYKNIVVKGGLMFENINDLKKYTFKYSLDFFAFNHENILKRKCAFYKHYINDDNNDNYNDDNYEEFNLELIGAKHYDGYYHFILFELKLMILDFGVVFLLFIKFYEFFVVFDRIINC
eukprot:46500_1